MSRDTAYTFVDTDSATIMSSLIATYEKITGKTLQPSSPDRLFISWVADLIIKILVKLNYVGNQNIPSSAEGIYLDALGEWIFSLKRKEAQASKCTVRFYITDPQETAISIKAGTRVTDVSQSLVWKTTQDVLIPIGDTYVDAMVQCETTGTIGNGYEKGQINTLIDVDNILYFSNLENTTVSDGGAERQTDEEYFQAMRNYADSYSTAGAEGSYIYWAQSVSSEIADVKAVCPNIEREETLPIYSNINGEKYAFFGGDQIDIDTIKVYTEDSLTLLSPDEDYTVSYSNGLITIAIEKNGAVATADNIQVKVFQQRAGYVYLYALMDDGTIASETIKEAIYETCNSKEVRPLTDFVQVEDPEVVNYNINFTYYISRETQLSLYDIDTAVKNAVNEYVSWQSGKLGRDINPDKLRDLLYDAGIKRVEVTSPVFTALNSGIYNDIPQVAALNNKTIINGGYEDE